MWYDERAKKLNEMVRGPTVHDRPLLKVVDLMGNDLRNVVLDYVEACCRVSEVSYEKVLQGSEQPVMMTPGGVLRPGREVAEKYARVVKELRSVVESRIVPGGEWQWPFCVRLVTPVAARDVWRRGRPYNTFVKHSDVWSGQPRDMVHLWLPLFGDFVGTGMEWWEPQNFPVDLQRQFTTYWDSETKGLVEGAVQYKVPIQLGMMYVSDGLVLHRTVPREGAHIGRVTIDMRMRAGVTREYWEYVSPGDWGVFSGDRSVFDKEWQ